MNLLSVVSIIISTAFVIGAGHLITAERKSVLNISGGAVLISLAWWSFCNSFFFAAETTTQAWFWHKLSAIGWCGFVALTAYYFLALTKDHRKMPSLPKQLLFFAPPIILICANLFGETTSLAQSIVMSANGNGWTYQNSVTSVWLWIYMVYVAAYFGTAFLLLYRWSKTVKHKMKKAMAIKFIILDFITILFGIVTDVIFPLTVPLTPALASIGTAIFGIGYFTTIYKFDVFNIDTVISSDDILQTVSNAVFVMDERKEILKCNRAAQNLLGYGKSELIGVDFATLAAEALNFSQLYSGYDLSNIEVKMRCSDGLVKDVLLAANVAKDARHNFLCIIVSCQDISKQKKIQEELSLEREKYKSLADDYQKLAYYDPLTGLPNRRSFFDTLNAFEQKYKEKQRDFAVIYMDLDNFKQANDIYGHKGGDELLQAASEKLLACAHKDAFLARIGGDEFTIIMPCEHASAVDLQMKKIRDEFHRGIMFSGSIYEIGISAGYSIFSQIGDTAKLMHKADEAMYINKKETPPPKTTSPPAL